ncbi:MAG TPA: response regulator, partial [Rhodocyclaceae bacterium]
APPPAAPAPVPRTLSAAIAAAPEGADALPCAQPLPDDREALAPGDKSILIIEDDLAFAKILQSMAKERGFATLVAADGESGIALAGRFQPSAIVLDVMLPHIDGWGVMRSLKDNPRTRHIPVHFITCMEDRQKAMAMGAIGFATKPVSVEQLTGVLQSIEGSLAKSVRRLLIVEDDRAQADSMVALLGEGGVEIKVAATGKEAIGLLAAQPFDCLVLDLGLTDMSGFELLEYIQNLDGARRIPVIIHSGRELSHDDERRLRRYAESIIIKGAKSPERLLNEVTLFLHLVESNLNPSKQRMIRTAIDKEAQLEGRKVLLVDDDMRNVFSLSSVLAEKNMVVIEAENGREALARLDEHDDIGIVLMDIMMPEMDGYAAMREIRKNPRFVNIPIIAMTAKALKGDHEKCMAAGASDYISKPLDVDKLLSLIRVWIFQHG